MAKNKNVPSAYKRILEILDEYWLSEPEELAVCVSMEFLKANGENQAKEIRWVNPNYESINKGPLPIIKLSDVQKDIGYPHIKIDYRNYRKKED